MMPLVFSKSFFCASRVIYVNVIVTAIQQSQACVLCVDNLTGLGSLGSS